MRILIIGAGYVGRPLCGLLEAAGHEVVAVTRSGGVGSVVADVTDRESMARLLEEVGGVDAAVHCASAGVGVDRLSRYRSVYLEGCRNVVEVFAPGRFIFVSSSSVYGQVDGSMVDEGSPAEPAAETGNVLLEAEAVARGVGGMVARLTGIYGPGRSYLLKRYISGEAQIDGGATDVDGRWINQIHRGDAASALAFLVSDGADGEIYNVSDDTPLTQHAVYEELDRRFGKGLPESRPADMGKARGWTDKRVSNARLRAAGWEPNYGSYFDALDGDPELLRSIVG